MDEPVDVIRLDGFDPEGEPEIRRSAGGGLWLVFNFMPPSWADEEGPGLGRWAGFDRELERAVGTPVVWEDREVFRIDRPRGDMVGAIRRFLAEYQRRHGAGA
jgi:hypothetical protein